MPTASFGVTFDAIKRDLKILILGPYRPNSAETRLFAVKDHLIRHGYESAKVVADFADEPRYHQDPDIHFLLKSKDYIKNWADVLIFVLFTASDNQGVCSEMQTTCEKVEEKVHFSYVLYEEGITLSTLVKGEVKAARITSNTFEDDRELCELAKGFCTDVAYQRLAAS
jgi:hypothetical protein